MHSMAGLLPSRSPIFPSVCDFLWPLPMWRGARTDWGSRDSIRVSSRRHLACCSCWAIIVLYGLWKLGIKLLWLDQLDLKLAAIIIWKLIGFANLPAIDDMKFRRRETGCFRSKQRRLSFFINMQTCLAYVSIWKVCPIRRDWRLVMAS
jgi:hypothetical protein